MQVTITFPKPFAAVRHWKWVALALVALAPALLRPAGPVAALGNTITSPDTAGVVGQWTSLTLDTSGNPVVSYYDATNKRVKLLHCGDPNCASSNIIGPIDNASVGFGTSVAIDSAGDAAVSYIGDLDVFPYLTLKVVRCKDPYCVGLDANVAAPDPSVPMGGYSSLTLDSIGRPVVSSGGAFGGLYLTYCGTTDCSAANSNTNANSTGIQWTSIALDSLGKPVVSYANGSLGELGLLHCGNANCNSGNSIVDPDTGNVGQYTSLKLDIFGYPVVSYYDFANQDLKLMHCNDADCISSPNIVTIDAVGDVGKWTSLALDSSGNPVISYYDATNGDLKLVRCGDANCNTYLKVFVDQAGDVGQYSSLELGASGNPVISYYDATNHDLKLAHCIEAQCTGEKPPTVLNITNLGQYALPKTCFDVGVAVQTYFTVCDNDFAGAPASNGLCLGDGICNDEDPNQGVVKVTMSPGNYLITESTVAPQHTALTTQQGCNVSGCQLTFLNTPSTRPWFPWDFLGGPNFTPDGHVTVLDILAVVTHYNQVKPLPTPTPSPTPTPTPCIFC